MLSYQDFVFLTLPWPETKKDDSLEFVERGSHTTEQKMQLTPIKNDEHLAHASKVVDQLLAMDRDSGQDEYLDAMTDLIEAYEDSHIEIKKSTPQEMLKHLLDARGLTQAALAKNTDVSKSTISEILAGKDRLSKRVALKLADFFSVNPAVFLKG